MKSQIIKFVLAVAIGVAIGVPLAVHNAAKPAIVRQLSEITNNQRLMDQRLAAIEQQQRFVADVVRRWPDPSAPTQPAAQRPPSEDYDKVHNIPVAHSPVKGNPDAPVTIVEFIDLQCPFCKRFHAPVNEILKAYPEKVRYIAKNFPLPMHGQARPAAKAAFAAGEQGKYWEMLEALLDNGASLNEEKFKELAGQIGLDVEQFMKDYREKDAQWEQMVNQDMSLGSQVDVRGTPTFYLNGRKTNARDFDTWKAQIEQILSEG
jgi:protein-disulfide isomerase